MSDAGHGNKGDKSRVSSLKQYQSSPLWDNIGPNKKKPKAKTTKDK